MSGSEPETGHHVCNGVNARYIKESVEEIGRWSPSTWAVGVYVSLPLDYPLDPPGRHPIWQAIDAEPAIINRLSFRVKEQAEVEKEAERLKNSNAAAPQ